MHGVANSAAHQGKRHETSRSSGALDSFHRVSGFKSKQRGEELLFYLVEQVGSFKTSLSCAVLSASDLKSLRDFHGSACPIVCCYRRVITLKNL